MLRLRFVRPMSVTGPSETHPIPSDCARKKWLLLSPNAHAKGGYSREVDRYQPPRSVATTETLASAIQARFPTLQLLGSLKDGTLCTVTFSLGIGAISGELSAGTERIEITFGSDDRSTYIGTFGNDPTHLGIEAYAPGHSIQSYSLVVHQNDSKVTSVYFYNGLGRPRQAECFAK